MTKRLIHCARLLITLLALSISIAQAQTANSQTNGTVSQANGRSEFQFSALLAQTRRIPRWSFSLMPSSSGARATAPLFNIAPAASGPSLPVVGGGTLGRLTKWAGFTSSNSFIGDTTIFEDKNGLVGIGTDTPTSRLSVAGTIQSLSGGFKFPDGTLQITAGIAPSQVVRSLNGLMGDVTLAAGANITITPSGNTLTIAAPNSLTSIAHDATLQGNGTSGSPLGVAVPLNLTGAVPLPVSGVNAVINATNTAAGGNGVSAIAGNGDFSGGFGVIAQGGSSTNIGGGGVIGKGGSGNSIGGIGVRADGGSSGVTGGTGVSASGGFSNTNGGDGVAAFGGVGTGAGNSGGNGIVAFFGDGLDGAMNGLAGKFFGDVEITGTLKVDSGVKMFHIDHPLDPENKYLNHVAIESSEVLNVYSGNISTDNNGDAVVVLPNWFEALNSDFRYQLTVIGSFAQAIIAKKIKGNLFSIKTNEPNVEVSWQVTGVRSDPTARKYPLEIEEAKAERDRGYYLNPDAYGQPEERGIQWARHPEAMRQHEQRRIEAEQKLKLKQQQQ